MFDMWSIVTLLFFFEVLILVNSQTCRVCDQFISGRNLPYERALAIIQDEEYLDDSDFDEIRYKRRYDSQSYNEVFHRWHSRVKRAEGRKIDLGFSHEFFEFFGCLTPDDQCITSRSELDSALSTRFSQGEKDSFCDFQEDLDLQLVCHTPIGYVFRPYPNLTGSGELLITNCDEERSYAAQLIEYISNAFSCPSPIEEFMEMVMDFVEENAPTTAAAGASAAAGGIAMSPSLPMTASSGTPPGQPTPGTAGGGGTPNGASGQVLALTPVGLNTVAVFPPFANARTIPAMAVIFAEDPSIGASVAGAAGRKRRSSVFQRANHAIFQSIRSSPLVRRARAWFRQTKSYLQYKTKMIKSAIEEFKQKVKRKLSKEYIKEKIQEKMDDLSCLTTRLEFYGKQRRKKLKGKWPGQHKYNGTSHNFVKRAVDSMDDCFGFMDEPLYGLRVNISQEVNCTGLGDDCGINEFQSSNNSDTRFAVRQTGEEFRSEAPPDCRIVVCGTDGTVPATLTTTVAPTTTSTTTTTTTTPITTTAPTAAVPPTTTTPVPTAAPITSAPIPPITSATVPPITTTVPPTTFAITVPQTPTSAQVFDEPDNQLIHQRIVPFGIEDAMVIKPEEIVEESILQQGQSTSDILNNIDDSDSESDSDDNDYVYDDIRSTSEIAPIYVRPVLNQAFYNPTYYQDEK